MAVPSSAGTTATHSTSRREGLVGFDQAQVYLPLRAGDNVLSVVVSDSFGGWAVMGRLRDSAGVTVVAR
jgi:hypothetical protein